MKFSSCNLTARRVSAHFILVASVITTEFVTLTVTVFVKEAFKRRDGRPFSFDYPPMKNIFSTFPGFLKRLPEKLSLEFKLQLETVVSAT
ncbi:MAG: hypothetical protein ACT4OT_10335 [Acidobacteriota bacterium]